MHAVEGEISELTVEEVAQQAAAQQAFRQPTVADKALKRFLCFGHFFILEMEGLVWNEMIFFFNRISITAQLSLAIHDYFSKCVLGHLARFEDL